MDRLYTRTIALFIGALLLISSCSKRDTNYGAAPGGSKSMDKSLEAKIRMIASKLPHVNATNSGSSTQRNGGGSMQGSGWDFSTGGGVNFTSSNGITYSESANTFNISNNGG